jgi:predicted DNA-binding transcriptional regulator YafY
MLSSVQEDLPKSDIERKIIQSESISTGRGFEHFDIFFSACRERIPVNFAHYSYTNRTFKSITIHPIILKEFENRWYVIGHSELHNSLRTFGFDRIYSPLAIRKKFISTSDKIKDEYLNDVYGVYPLRDGKKEKIIIHTSPIISNYFRSHKVHESQEIKILGRGDAIITFELVPSMELVRLFLSYGNQLEVKEPKRLKDFIEKNRD